MVSLWCRRRCWDREDRLAAKLKPLDEATSMLASFSEDIAATGHSAEYLTSLGQSGYDAIARWTYNDLFADMYGILRKRTCLVRSMTRAPIEVEVESYREHRDILSAICAGDSDGARLAMERHLKRTNEAVMRLLLNY